jgi:hypothetical protein
MSIIGLIAKPIISRAPDSHHLSRIRHPLRLRLGPPTWGDKADYKPRARCIAFGKVVVERRRGGVRFLGEASADDTDVLLHRAGDGGGATVCLILPLVVHSLVATVVCVVTGAWNEFRVGLMMTASVAPASSRSSFSLASG